MKNSKIISLAAILTSVFLNSLSLGDVVMQQKMSSFLADKIFYMESTSYFKGKNVRLDIRPAKGTESGPAGNMTVYSNKQGHYTCTEKTKTCNKMPTPFSPIGGQFTDSTKGEKLKPVTFTKTDKKDQVAGFDCTYYSVVQDSSKSVGCYSTSAMANFSKEMTEANKESINKMTVSDEVKKSLLQVADLGIPLKFEVEMSQDSPNNKLTSEVLSLKVEPLADSLFQLPKGYRTVEVASGTESALPRNRKGKK